jgi:hypothetical protein
LAESLLKQHFDEWEESKNNDEIISNQPTGVEDYHDGDDEDASRDAAPSRKSSRSRGGDVSDEDDSGRLSKKSKVAQ